MDKLEEIKRIFDNAPENNGPKKIADSISISGRSVGVIGNNNTIVQTEKLFTENNIRLNQVWSISRKSRLQK